MRVADRLALAAAPVFALMALLTQFGRVDPASMLCGAGGSTLGGMAPMYLLMTLFHAPPWIRLVGSPPARP
jgi:hypothetical protein